MRHTPHYMLRDPGEVKRIIRDNPWMTLVSSPPSGLVASHGPFLLEEHEAGISLVSHLGRPDDEQHLIGSGEVMLVAQGPHGYISPGWYPEGQIIPTWNHVTAHLYGTPEILGDDENFRVLEALVDHFEAPMPSPSRLDLDPAYSRRIARGTVGIRVRVTRFEARAKLSQDKAPEVVDRIIDALRTGPHYPNAALAAEMSRVRTRSSDD